MATSVRSFYSQGENQSPLRRQPSTQRRNELLASPPPGDPFRQMLRAMHGLSDQIRELKKIVGEQSMEIKQTNEEIQQLREVVERNGRPTSPLVPGPTPKRIKRANNVTIAVSEMI